MKKNQRKQAYKLLAGFLVVIYVGSLYPSLLFSIIPLSIIFTIYFYLMDIMGRHPELNTGKTKYPIFIGIKVITQYIFKSIYFNLRKSPQFIFNTIILGLPLIGVYLDWTASDFVLVCFWNIAGSYICLWLLSSFGFYGPKSFGKTIGTFFSFFFIFFFIFLALPLIGMKNLIELSPAEIFTLSLEENAYILLGETFMCMISIILIRILKKKDFESYEGRYEGEVANIVFGYFLLMIPALFILPFAQNYSELYAKNPTIFDIVLSCILLFFLIIKENVYFLSGYDARKQWFAKYDEFYNNKRPIV
jgi:hypothetical protein